MTPPENMDPVTLRFLACRLDEEIAAHADPMTRIDGRVAFSATQNLRKQYRAMLVVEAIKIEKRRAGRK